MTNARFSLMMFLQYFIGGSWFTSIAVYMAANGMQNLIHWPYTVNPLAAMIAPVFVGMIADRYFATQKVMGTLHLMGGAVLFLIPTLTETPVWFIVALAGFNLLNMPTTAMTSAIAFRHISNREKQFPLIRVFGTLGWIAAGLSVSIALGYVFGSDLPEATSAPLYMAGIVSLIMGLYSFSLPHTPPSPGQAKPSISEILGISAVRELGSRPFYVLAASLFLISIPQSTYYNFTQIFLVNAGFQEIAATQTLGQTSEVIFMVLMPLFFARFGFKTMFLIGFAGWVFRFALFALGAPTGLTSLILIGIFMHGISFDFLQVTAQVYVDRKSNDRIRNQAQAFLILASYGPGMLLGAQLAGFVYNAYLGGQEALNLEQWASFWWLPCIVSAIVMLGFAMAFRPKETAVP